MRQHKTFLRDLQKAFVFFQIVSKVSSFKLIMS